MEKTKVMGVSEREENDREESAPAAPANNPLMAQLKSIYDDVADQPIPDDLLDLLKKLDEAERER